jgi:hypothetical protein
MVVHTPPGLLDAVELAELQSAHVLAPRMAHASRRLALLMAMHPRLGQHVKAGIIRTAACGLR